MPSASLICDGCGQAADQEHFSRRLQRLENMTRYRPIHVQVLFLAALSPVSDTEHLYSAEGEFDGEGLRLLRALGFELTGRNIDAILADFQRRGFLLVHALECPSQSEDSNVIHGLLEKGLAATAVRIRRSLKPKKLVLLGEALEPLMNTLTSELPGIEIVRPEKGNSFRLNDLGTGSLASALTAATAASL